MISMTPGPDNHDDLPRIGDAPLASLWNDDTGHLPEESRRALLQLIKGPYLALRRHPALWPALLRDEDAIRVRLHELFLDLVVDPVGEIAFVRNVEGDDETLPKTVRSAPLTFLDTAMLLTLRQHLLNGDGSDRVIVGKDEIAEQLETFRYRATDQSGFANRVNASWSNMKKYGLIADASRAGDRVEVSPTLRLVFGPDEIAAVRDEYRRIAAQVASGAALTLDIAIPGETSADETSTEDIIDDEQNGGSL